MVYYKDIPSWIKTYMLNNYQELWDTLDITNISKVSEAMIRILYHKDKYLNVQYLVKVPWFVIGILHYRESDLDFTCCLANGDPLGQPTVNVPVGYTWDTWEESVLGAFQIMKWALPDEWSLVSILEFIEQYNGTGYRKYGINSPYLWSMSNHYSKGLYVSDGKFDPDFIDTQCGAITIMYLMNDKGFISL